MKLKHLLTLGVLALCSTAVWAQDVDNDKTIFDLGKDKGFVTLPYSDAIYYEGFNTDNSSVGDGITADGHIDYNINVNDPGDYILYLEVDCKKMANGKAKFQILEDNNSIFLSDNIIDTGEWGDKYFYKIPAKISLSEGSHKLTIKSDGDRRWIVNKDVSPVIVNADFVNEITEDNGGTIRTLYAWPGSTEIWTRVMSKGDVSSADKEGALVTSKTKDKYKASKLYYPVNVAEKGTYPVIVSGDFFQAPNWSNTARIDFTVSVKKADTPEGNLTDLGTISNFSKSTDGNFIGTGNVSLEKGQYYLEISSNSEYDDLFFIKEMSFGELSNDVVITLNTPLAYLDHEFTLSGDIINAPEAFEVNIYMISEDEETHVGKAEVNEEKTSYTLDVTAEQSKQLFPSAGQYSLIAKVENNGDELAESETLTLTIEKQKFTFTLKGGENGKVQAGSATANNGTAFLNNIEEGSTVEFNVTPNEGYFVSVITISDSGNKSQEFKRTRKSDSWNEFTFSSNWNDKMNLDKDTEVVTFNLQADQPYTVSVQFEQHVVPLRVIEDGCTTGNSYFAIHVDKGKVTTNDWRLYERSSYDSELGWTTWTRLMPYGYVFNMWFEEKEGTKLVRLLDNDREVETSRYDSYSYKDGVEPLAPAHMYQVSMTEPHLLHAIFAYEEYTFTVNPENEGAIENGSVEVSLINSSSDDDEVEGEENEEENVEDTYSLNTLSDNKGVYTFNNVEHGLKSVRLKITPDDGYIVESAVLKQGNDETVITDALDENGEYDVLVKSGTPVLTVSFTPSIVEYYLANSMTAQYGGAFTPNPSYKFQETEDGNTYTLTVGNVSSTVEFYVIEVKDGVETTYSASGYTNMLPGVENGTTKLVADDTSSMTLDNNYVNVTFTLTVDEGAPYSLYYTGDVNGDVWTVSPGNDQTMQSGTVTGKNIDLASASEAALIYIYAPSNYSVDTVYYTLESETLNTESTENEPDIDNQTDEDMLRVARKADLNIKQATLVEDETGKYFTVSVQKGTQGTITLYNSAEANTPIEGATFTYTLSTTAVPTAVESIETEDTKAEYYTLQGLKVANPEKGIFIKVLNGKAMKVIM